MHDQSQLVISEDDIEEQKSNKIKLQQLLSGPQDKNIIEEIKGKEAETQPSGVKFGAKILLKKNTPNIGHINKGRVSEDIKVTSNIDLPDDILVEQFLRANESNVQLGSDITAQNDV